jgi:type I restriction enzyme S subunit
MKYEYIHSGIEWIVEYPKHWKVFRISQRVENVVGGEWGSEPDSDDTEGTREIVVLRVSDFNDIYLSYDNLTIRRVKESKIPNRLISNNCLIMEKSGGGEKQLVGRVAEAKDLPFEAITSNFIAKIVFDTKVNSHFMNYVFHDLYNSNLNFPFVQQTTGIQNINSTYYLYTKVPFPPKQEQLAIAKYLEKACANIDRVVEIKRKQIENLQQQLKSIIHRTVTKGLNPNTEMKDSGIDWIGEVPKHWREYRLKDILEKVGSGVTPKGGAAEYLDEGIPLIRSQNVLDDRLIFEDIAFISDEIHNDMSNSQVKYGDVLLNITGASLGRCFYYSSLEEANVNQHVCILRPFKKVETKYLHLLMISDFGQTQIEQGFTGSGREGLNFKSIKRFSFILPPRTEQIEIIKYFENISEKTKAVQSKIEKQIDVLLHYKKSLIHEVVTGKKQVYGLTKEKQQMQTA